MVSFATDGSFWHGPAHVLLFDLEISAGRVTHVAAAAAAAALLVSPLHVGTALAAWLLHTGALLVTSGCLLTPLTLQPVREKQPHARSSEQHGREQYIGAKLSAVEQRSVQDDLPAGPQIIAAAIHQTCTHPIVDQQMLQGTAWLIVQTVTVLSAGTESATKLSTLSTTRAQGRPGSLKTANTLDPVFWTVFSAVSGNLSQQLPAGWTCLLASAGHFRGLYAGGTTLYQMKQITVRYGDTVADQAKVLS